MIIGGIVFVNTIQVKNNHPASSTIVMKNTQEFFDIMEGHNSQPIITQSQAISIVMLFFGIVTVVAGIYDYRHKLSLSLGKTQPPGTT